MFFFNMFFFCLASCVVFCFRWLLVENEQMSNEQNPGCLVYIGDYTTQLCGDYNKPL